MIKTVTKEEMSDLTKAKNAFLDPSSFDNLIQLIADATFDAYRHASYEPKDSKTEIGDYQISDLNFYYSFQKEQVEIYQSYKFNSIINHENPGTKFFFDDYFRVGELNLSRRKGSQLASDCFNACKLYRFSVGKIETPQVFVQFAKDYLFKEVLKTANQFFCNFKTVETLDNSNLWEVLYGRFPIRFLNNLESLVSNLSSKSSIEKFAREEVVEKTFENVFLSDNRFFSDEQIEQIKNHLNETINSIEYSNDIVDNLIKLSSVVNSGFCSLDYYVNYLNEKVSSSRNEVFESVFNKNPSIITKMTPAIYLKELKDQTLIDFFNNLNDFRIEKHYKKTLSDVNRNSDFKSLSDDLLKEIDSRDLSLNGLEFLMFNDFNTDVFLSSKAVKNLKEVNLLATTSSTLNLIYEINRHYATGWTFNRSALDHPYLEDDNNSSGYLIDILEERSSNGTRFYVPEEFHKNLKLLDPIIDQGFVFSSNPKVNLDIKRFSSLLNKK